MAYKIVYGEDKRSKRGEVSSGVQIQALTAAFLLAFSLGVKQFWPEGTEVLRNHLIPNEDNAIQMAFAELTEGLSAGESLGETVTAFCREIINRAQSEDTPYD